MVGEDEELEACVLAAMQFAEALERWSIGGPPLLGAIPNEDLLLILLSVPNSSRQFLINAREELDGTFAYRRPTYPAPGVAYVLFPFIADFFAPGIHETQLEPNTLAKVVVVTLVYAEDWPEGFQWRVLAVGDYVLPEHIHRAGDS